MITNELNRGVGWWFAKIIGLIAVIFGIPAIALVIYVLTTG